MRRASARRPGTASWMFIMLSRLPAGADSDHRAQSVRRRQPAHVAAVLGGMCLVSDLELRRADEVVLASRPRPVMPISGTLQARIISLDSYTPASMTITRQRLRASRRNVMAWSCSIPRNQATPPISSSGGRPHWVDWDQAVSALSDQRPQLGEEIIQLISLYRRKSW